MDLDFTEEQEILRTSARNFLKKECDHERVREIEDSEDGYSKEIWRKMAELGWMGIAFPEQYGGYGGEFMNLIILMEEIGRGILPSPFFSTVVLSGFTILEGGSEDQKKEFLEKIAAGELIMALALYEGNGSYKPSGITTKATRHDGAFVIEGQKMFVNDANVADYLIVATRTRQRASPEEGITLFLVGTKSKGVSCNKIRTIGADNQCEVILAHVIVPKENMLGDLDKGWPILNKAIEKATVVKCAEVMGGMEASLEMTNGYAKEREQYGKTIGSFQVIQHYLANMFIKVHTAKNLTYEAAWMAGEQLPCAYKVSAAKSYVNEAYKFVTERGVQIHGAIGTTREHSMGLYYRRAKAADLFLGDTAHHLELVAQELFSQTQHP
ncbi:MAG: acyl-CoA dehydrogenase family protein [Pseudomonadota bacterium]